MKLLLITAIALPVLAVLPACTDAKQAKDIAVKAADRFHDGYNARQFAGLYNAASYELRALQSQTAFVKYMESAWERFGKFSSHYLTGWNVHTINGNTSAVMEYQSEGERGTAAEKFTWYIDGSDVELVKYEINPKGARLR